MDSKNAEAITYGPEYMLAKFANLPDKPGDSEPAKEFRERCGDVFPGLYPEKYWVDVGEFRKAWHAKKPLERGAVGRYLSNLFSRNLRFHVKSDYAEWLERGGTGPGPHGILSGDARYYPAVKVDFSSGKVSPTSATLLDWLASSLLECRHRLGICEREGCSTPFFVKDHPRRRYCSEDCFRQSRQGKKNQWWKDHRGKASKKAAPTREIRTKRSTKRGRR